MNGALKALILTALVTGRPTFHEALPDSFGRDAKRWDLLRQCLLRLLQSYEGLQINLSGSKKALDAFGLRAGVDELVGDALVRVSLGATDRPDAMRLTFSDGAKRPVIVPGARPGHKFL
jgi:hypothetical protein